MMNRLHKKPREPFSFENKTSIHQLTKYCHPALGLVTFYLDEAFSNEAQDLFKSNSDIANRLFAELRSIFGNNHLFACLEDSGDNEEWESFLNRDVSEIDSKTKCAVYYLHREKKEKGPLLDLLRHIRNSIAHRNFYILCIGNSYRILFEDRNSNGSIRARIVLYQLTLKKWKAAIASCLAANGICVLDC